MSQGMCGKKFLFVDDQGNQFAQARVTTLSMNSSLVDATTKSTNGWTEYIPDCGIKSMTMALAGLYTDESYERTLLEDFMSGTIKTYSIIDGYGNDITGEFAIQDYEQTGAHDGGQEFSATLVSSNTPVYTPAP